MFVPALYSTNTRISETLQAIPPILLQLHSYFFIFNYFFPYFNEAEKEQSVSEREEEKSIVVNGHSRKKKRTRDEIFKDLPVEEVIHKADTDVCPECQSPMQTIGKEYVHEELVYVPAKMFRRKHYVEVVKCPVCGEYTEKSINDKTVIIKGHDI